MAISNGLVGGVEEVADGTGAEVVGVRKVSTANGALRKLRSAEEIVEQALSTTAKFFRDTQDRQLERVCLKFREVRGKVTATPMWSSEFDKEGWQPDADSILIKREGFYDPLARGIANNDHTADIKSRAQGVVRNSFGEFLSDQPLATVVPIGSQGMPSGVTQPDSVVAMHSRF